MGTGRQDARRLERVAYEKLSPARAGRGMKRVADAGEKPVVVPVVVVAVAVHVPLIVPAVEREVAVYEAPSVPPPIEYSRD